MATRVMVMAGGTGGHVFPALAVADVLREQGAEVFWLGTREGFEARAVPEFGYPMEWVPVRGLRGGGWARWLLAPVVVLRSALCVARVLRRRRPAVALGLGGFVTGPGGLVSRLLGVPLVIHEQNAVPGLTNRWLSRIANRVLEAFPGSFPVQRGAHSCGNPVRAEIAGLMPPEQRFAGRSEPKHLLVVGGSQGAQALNQAIPQALALLPPELRPQVRHQAGKGKLEQTRRDYAAHAVEAEVSEFVHDMATAYAWADLVICRAGALTVSELEAAGVGAILVPYPHAVDDHQARNAEQLVRAGAAVMLRQAAMTPEVLADQLRSLLSDRDRLLHMARAARGLAQADAAASVARACLEVAR